MSNAGKGKALIITLVVITLIAITFLAFMVGYYVLGNNDKPLFNRKPKSETEITLPLKEFVVRLAGEDKSFIKITMNLGYTNKKATKEIEKNMDQIEHVVNMTLMSKKSQELDVKGVEALLKELAGKINDTLGKETITNIYINDIIIQ